MVGQRVSAFSKMCVYVCVCVCDVELLALKVLGGLFISALWSSWICLVFILSH